MHRKNIYGLLKILGECHGISLLWTPCDIRNALVLPKSDNKRRSLGVKVRLWLVTLFSCSCHINSPITSFATRFWNIAATCMYIYSVCLGGTLETNILRRICPSGLLLPQIPDFTHYKISTGPKSCSNFVKIQGDMKIHAAHILVKFCGERWRIEWETQGVQRTGKVQRTGICL